MSENVDLNLYKKFVLEVCSQDGKDLESFIARLRELANNKEVNVPLLMVAGIGLGSEGGEFEEIVKKIMFQGKPLTGENIYHMKRELGDVMWYWMNACNALNLDPNEIIQENVNKLQARYPGGKFSVQNSEVRKEGDL